MLTVSNKIAPAAIRGVRAAARPAIKWERSPTHGLLRQQRVTLRDGARAAWVRMRAARAKIGAAVRSAWRCRSLLARHLESLPTA